MTNKITAITIGLSLAIMLLTMNVANVSLATPSGCPQGQNGLNTNINCTPDLKQSKQPPQPMTLPNPKPNICVKDNCGGIPLPHPKTGSGASHHASNQLIGDSTCCYTTPTNIDAGHTSTFDSFVISDHINGTPVSFRLSFDWS